MSPARPVRLAVAALAPLAALGPSVPAVADDEDPVLHCWTIALTPEEMDEGATSEIWCDDEELDLESWAGAPLRSTLLATHYTGGSGTGMALNVLGTCNSGVSFGPSDPWNNVISSTRHRACGNIKHYDNDDYTGDNELTQGGPGALVNLTTMDDRTSSVEYGT